MVWASGVLLLTKYLGYFFVLKRITAFNYWVLHLEHVASALLVLSTYDKPE